MSLSTALYLLLGMAAVLVFVLTVMLIRAHRYRKWNIDEDYARWSEETEAKQAARYGKGGRDIGKAKGNPITANQPEEPDEEDT